MNSLAHVLGLNEVRCLNCLVPFAPGATQDDSLASMIEEALCPECRKTFARAGQNACPRCGMSAASGSSGLLCGSCMHDPPPWEKLFFVGPYEGLLRQMIHKLKFSADFASGYFLGSMMASVLAEHASEYNLLIPVPIHPSRLMQRGYNQCRELARPVSAALKVKVDTNSLRRKKATVPQAGLNVTERRENIRDAFHCAPLKGGRILLLDDILTTGSTMRYAAEAVLNAGADSVDVVVAARTPLES